MCINAFSHISQLQDSNDIEIIYHFTEAGHGKESSDGLGAVIKKKVERMILGGKVINDCLSLITEKDCAESDDGPFALAFLSLRFLSASQIFFASKWEAPMLIRQRHFVRS